jgi:hypothetical protein
LEAARQRVYSPESDGRKTPRGDASGGERLPSDTSALDCYRWTIEEDRELHREAMEKEKEQLKRRNPEGFRNPTMRNTNARRAKR